MLFHRARVFVGVWWPRILAFFLALAATAVSAFWGYDESVNTMQPRNEIARNYGLLVAASWGVFIAIWRGQIATKQAEAAYKQADTANRQVEISERGLRNDRFQKGSDMLASKTLSGRLGGINALQRLAKDHPEEYLNQVIKVISAFARHPTEDNTLKINTDGEQQKARQDVLDAVWVISDLNESDEEHEKPELTGVDLRGSILSAEDSGTVNLSNMKLTVAKMNSTDLVVVKFIQADLCGADFTNAKLVGAEFTDANLRFAVLTDANLSAAIGLSQFQLDRACQHPEGGPPRNLPPGLKWDEGAAKERWIATYGEDDE